MCIVNFGDLVRIIGRVDKDVNCVCKTPQCLIVNEVKNVDNQQEMLTPKQQPCFDWIVMRIDSYG